MLKTLLWARLAAIEARLDMRRIWRALKLGRPKLPA